MTSNNKRFSPFSLDAINFLLADVRGALGPYLNLFLVTQRHWSQTQVGLVTTLGGLLGLAAQTPIGAAIDTSHRARARRAGHRGCNYLRPSELLAGNDRQLLMAGSAMSSALRLRL